jgi:hypothetical protein
MIYWLTREDYADTVEDLCQGLSGHFSALRPLSYEEVFFKKRAPIGHYIFSDFDRLSAYEIESAAALREALLRASPGSCLLNDPLLVRERVPLLTELYRTGLNDFSITRLDAGERPERFPVFIRMEDDCQGTDTALLHNPKELELALENLYRKGKVLKRRIAVEFCARPDEQGWYHKYGALNIRGAIIPQHILSSRDWNVKRRSSEYDYSLASKELEFIRGNPHREVLLKIFQMARIDFGRIDYAVVDGRVQTYEINTNPTFPNFKAVEDARSERRTLIRSQVIDALREIESVSLAKDNFRFPLPKPRLQRPRLPRKAGFFPRLFWAFKRIGF